MTTEQQVTIAAKLYAARKSMRFIYGDQYSEKVGEIIPLLERASQQWEIAIIPAAWKIVEGLQRDEPDSEGTQLLVLAACVDLIEGEASDG